MNIKSSTKPVIKEVVDNHEVVEKRQKSLTAGASILVKLAVAISMMYVNPVSGFMNLTGTTAVVTNAGFSSLCGDAAKSLIENDGDPKRAIKDLSNKETAINLGKAMLSSGLVHEISNVVGVTPAKELTEYAKKAAITSAVNTVLSTSIDGQPLDKAIKEGLTSAIISTGSSYLAGQIGELKPEIGDVNHKILHGLLGGVIGATNSKLFGGSFESGVISGAMGAVIAETVAEMLQDDVNTVMAEGAKKGKSLNQLQEEFMEKAKKSSKWGDFIAVVAAFGTGCDPSIANETATNATLNNNLGKTCAIALSVIAEQFGIWESVYAIGLSGGVKALLDSIQVKSLEDGKFSFNHIQYLNLEDVLRVAVKAVAPVTSIVARTVANMMDIDLTKPKVISTTIHNEKPLILTTPVQENTKTINEGYAINQEKIVNEGFKGYDGPDTSVFTKDWVKPYEVGTYKELKSRSEPRDGLEVHHAPQKHAGQQVIPGYLGSIGPSIVLPEEEHRKIPNIKGEYAGSARDLLAKDAHNLREFTNASNKSIQELIQLAKQQNPDTYQKKGK